jgi:hypothetical protein
VKTDLEKNNREEYRRRVENYQKQKIRKIKEENKWNKE